MILAYDRMPASVRRIDKDGRLHIDLANISKANVCPYFGREIPAVGLDPDRIYHMLRHPDELAAAAATFNNLPILDLHIPHTPDTPQQEYTVGTTGSNARFVAPYLVNDLAIWTREAIDRIEAADNDPQNPDGAKELSCGYHYTADMTSGVYGGLHYDGVMRNIIGNHVALVREGRAGPDVVIGDCRLETPKMLKSRRALMLSGAVSALVRPLLAADAQLNFEPVLSDVTAANLAERKTTLVTAIVGLVQPKLAADKSLDEATVTNVIDTILAVDADTGANDEIKEPVTPPAPAPVPTPAPSPAPAPSSAPAPAPAAADANIIRAEVMQEMRDVREAERLVTPYIGALDSVPDTAAAIYRLALDSAPADRKVDHAGITDLKALKALVQMLPKPDAGDTPKPGALAMDATARGTFDAEFGLTPVKKA